jgi:hypothetical protein
MTTVPNQQTYTLNIAVFLNKGLGQHSGSRQHELTGKWRWLPLSQFFFFIVV